jgi:kynurenine formamidase
VFLSHVNDPAATPLFPGDPAFDPHGLHGTRRRVLSRVVREGAYRDPLQRAGHFHDGALCMDDLSPSDLVLPAVVVDARGGRATRPIRPRGRSAAWEEEFGQVPAGAAVLLLTGCSDFWARGDRDGEPNYFNCGTGMSGVHQPGFSRTAVRWLIRTGVLAKTGALGTDTFGPDPSSDAAFLPTWLTLRRHRLTIENMTNLDALPPTGAYVVLGSPRNADGSGAPGTVFGLIP